MKSVHSRLNETEKISDWEKIYNYYYYKIYNHQL